MIRLCVASIVGMLACPYSTPAQEIPPTRIVQVAPEPIFESVRFDKWNGAPSGPSLSERVRAEGVLELTKDKGWLYVGRNYYDFRLEYETRLTTGGRHRVFFRTLEWPRQAYELRFDHKDGVLTGQLLAARWNMREEKFRIGDDVLRAATEGREWHRIEIRCEGTEAVILLNGHRTIAVGALDALGGAVGFAGQGVAYRSARLTPAPSATHIFNMAYVAGVEESLELPKVVREVRPQMPSGASRHRADYVVLVEAVIDEHGQVAAARFLRRLNESLGYNEEAMRAVRQWRFTPARLHGKAVPVLVTIELTFKWE